MAHDITFMFFKEVETIEQTLAGTKCLACQCWNPRRDAKNASHIRARYAYVCERHDLAMTLYGVW